MCFPAFLVCVCECVLGTEPRASALALSHTPAPHWGLLSRYYTLSHKPRPRHGLSSLVLRKCSLLHLVERMSSRHFPSQVQAVPVLSVCPSFITVADSED